MRNINNNTMNALHGAIHMLRRTMSILHGTMKHLPLIFLCLAMSLLTASCEKVDDRLTTPEEEVKPGEETDGKLGIEIKNESGKTADTEDIHLFVFDKDDQLVVHNYYANAQELAKSYETLSASQYTLLLVMNVGKDFTPPSTRAEVPAISLGEFLEWLTGKKTENPDLLTGVLQVTVENGKVEQVSIVLKDETPSLALLKLTINLPGNNLPDYPGTRAAATSRATDEYALRCIVEVYKAGTETLVRRSIAAAMPTGTAGIYKVEIPNLSSIAYDLRLWADYTPAGNFADCHYSTADLKAIVFNPDRAYTANSLYKDAFYANLSVDMTDIKDAKEQTLDMARPFARYRLVATDVETYKKLIEKDKYPALDKLDIAIRYEGYFPCSFDMVSGTPNDSKQGIFYASALSALTEQTCGVGSDFVLVNGTESSVVVTVVVSDHATGKAVSVVQGVTIHYKRGYLTTVSGNFLTAGKTPGSGGVNVDTSWEDDEFNVEF